MSDLQRLIMILIMMAATMITRFSPLLLFKREFSVKTKKVAEKLPYATMGLLVVYSLKDTFVTDNQYGLYELIGLGIIGLIYKLTDHVLASIGSGLFIYLWIVNLL